MSDSSATVRTSLETIKNEKKKFQKEEYERIILSIQLLGRYLIPNNDYPELIMRLMREEAQLHTKTCLVDRGMSKHVVTTTLILSASPATPTAGGVLSYAVYFNPPSIQQVTVEFDCGAVVQEIKTSSSQSASTVQTFQVDAFAIGQCTLQANNTFYSSNTIQLTVNQQLYISSSLIGWTGGQTVQVNVTSPNLISDQIPFLITCSLQSVNYTLKGSTLTPVTLPASLNGVSCLLSTQYSTQYYLNLQSTSVNIAAAVQLVVSSINPASFINVISGINTGTVAAVGANVGGGAGANNGQNNNNQPAQKRLAKRLTKAIVNRPKKTNFRSEPCARESN